MYMVFVVRPTEDKSKKLVIMF